MEIHDIPGSVTPDFTGQPPDLSALSLAVFESSSDVIYAKDRAGRMLYANPAALALIGKSARQVVGRTDREFLEDAAAAELVMANDRRIMLSGVAEEVEETVPLPDGTVRIWASRKVPYRDSQGKVIGLLGISRDITARKQLEAESRASRDRLSEVLSSITDGLAVIDTDWRCTYLNAAGADLLGVAPDTLVGQVVWDLYPEAEALNFGPAYRRAMQTQQAEHFEAFYPAPLNKWLECHAYPSPNGVSVFFRDVTHRHRDRQALERSEERFRRMFARNPIGVVTGDSSGQLLDANEAFLRIIGRTSDELQAGRIRWDELTPPEHLPQDAKAIEEVRAQGVSSVYEKEYLRPDGTRVPVMLACTQFGGDTEELLAFVIDISERKQAEERLRQREAEALSAARRLALQQKQMAAVMAAAPVGIYLADRDGALLLSSAENNRLWGEHPMSRSVAEYRAWKGWWADGSERHGQPVQPHEWALARALQGEHVMHDLVEIEAFGSSQRKTVLLRARPIHDEDGRIVNAVVTQIDITPQVEAERALRDSEARFRALADNLPQLAWMADRHGEVYWYNNRWLDYTGATAETLRNGAWRQLHHPDHVERVADKLQRHFENGEVWEDTFPLRARSGEYRWFLSRAVPIRDDEGQVVRWFGTNTDVTEQRAAQESLRDMDRRKDEFLAMLAHELRNPLAPITSSASLLPLVADDADRVRELAEVIGRQAGHMRELIDDLLDVSRVTRGLVVLECERVDLRRVLTEAIEQTRVLMEARQHRLHVSTPTELPVVMGDGKRLVQVFANILSNAAKYTPVGGEVTVTVACTAQHVEVAVQDNGQGMSPALLAHAFDLFAQGERTPDRSQGGLGLGLALVKRLIELHHGQVIASSAGVGQGSEFRITLPRVPGSADSTDPTGAMAHEAEAATRILIVDDNQDAASVLAMLLQAIGHQAHVEDSALNALKAARVMQPGVCLLDIGLPDMDGRQLAAELRRLPGMEGAQMAAVTGYGQPADIEAAHQAGFARHFVKPVDIQQLSAWLAEVQAGARKDAPA